MDSDSSMPPLAVLAEQDPLIKLCKQGDSHGLRLLLSGYPTQFVPSYINTPDQRGTPVLFHCIMSGCPPSVHVLLSFGAQSNGINARHDTPLHCACETGQIEIILLLLAYEANPHLVNMHGQRCYEMGSHSRSEKLKTEAMIKQAWQDIRREREIKQQAAQQHSSKISQSNNNQSNNQSVNRTSQRLSVMSSQTATRPTPLLSAALDWSLSSVAAERAQWREEAEQREFAAEGDDEGSITRARQSSLFDKLAEQVEQQNRSKHRSRASIINQLHEQAHSRRQTRQSINQTIDLQRQAAIASLERIAREARLDEIRAVMAEYCMMRMTSQSDKSVETKRADKSSQSLKAERILGRMFAHFCWALDIEEKQQQQIEQNRKREMEQAEQKTQVFLTSVDQEEDELAHSDHEQSLDHTIKRPDPNMVLLQSVADRYKSVSINPSTRSHLTTILTELGTILPMPSSILPNLPMPQKANKHKIKHSKRQQSIRPHSSDEKTSDHSKQANITRTKSQISTEFWRVAQWDEAKSPSHQSINQSVNQSLIKSNSRGRSAQSSSFSRTVPSMNFPVSHKQTGTETVNLSAMIMQQINSQINQRKKHQKKQHLHMGYLSDPSHTEPVSQSVNRSMQSSDRAQREAFILSVFPDLTPSDTLFELLLASPIDEQSDEDLLTFFQSSEFLPSPEALDVMFKTLQDMQRNQTAKLPVNQSVQSPTEKRRRLKISNNQSINQANNHSSQPMFPLISPNRIPPHLPADTELVSHAAPFFHLPDGHQNLAH